MVTINLYLKGAISDATIEKLQKDKDSSLNEILRTPRQVFLTVSGLGKRIQIYTKKRVSQYEWDKETQAVDCRKNKVNGPELNDWFINFKQAVKKRNSTNENEGKITSIIDLREILDEIIPQGTKKTALTFKDYFERFIKEHKTGDGHSKKGRTVQKYNTLNFHLINYTQSKKIPLRVEIIDASFLTNFKNYLVTTLNLGDNTVAKYIKAAKTFIRFYINAGVIKPFNYTDVKSVEKEGEIYIISLKQLIELQNFKLENKRLEHCRDVFCFQCWTGQRYSDIEAIRFEDLKVNEKGEKIWDFYTIKTGENIKVPITEYAEMILTKYAGSDKPLPVISNQKQNDYLKDLGEIVSKDNADQKKISGFGDNAKAIAFHDGVRSESYLPFYRILTTHVARKSYITNSLIIGVPERVVKEVSGHKSEKDFRRYVNLANTYKDEMIRKSFSMENISKFI